MSDSKSKSLDVVRNLEVSGKTYDYYSLNAAVEAGLGDVSRLPFSLKVVLENLLRHHDEEAVTLDDLHALVAWQKERRSDAEIAYSPGRILMQDFTGVPAVVDLAAMRDAMKDLGGDPKRINPLRPVDLVIDHSVVVDHFGTPEAFQANVDLEMKRNLERYTFLRWGQGAFDHFGVVPPGTGICHQVNLEYLAQVVWTDEVDGRTVAFPDTLVGTDSHTTMINGLAVLGWGVGGIEAEAAMLGQPLSMRIPEVVGMKLTGALKEGTTATDLVLTVTQMLRAKGVVGKFVEFYGPGLDQLTLADRAVISNMGPEYGATCGFFPIDEKTIEYLKLSGRKADRIELVEAYAKAQGMWRDASSPDPVFTDTVELELDTVVPSLAGPKRPADRIRLDETVTRFKKDLDTLGAGAENIRTQPVEGTEYTLEDGHVVIAAITSCTNTSNPALTIGAGLVARKAAEKGLKVKPWVKTSLAPGSQVVTDYLKAAGVQDALDTLGFNLTGYGCTTCIGNSGPLPPPIAGAVEAGDLAVCAVLSGNRNFEGRVSPHTKANYLASPPLVVAYALAGSMRVDLYNDSLGNGADGKPVYLRDIWPTNAEIQEAVAAAVNGEMFASRYADVFQGTEAWREIASKPSLTYDWDAASTYVQKPPFFEGMSETADPTTDILDARPLALLGDMITTDHISPAGVYTTDSPAGTYLTSKGVAPADFNSFGSRRGNHEVMMRGTFANIRLANEIAPGTTGGVTRYMPDGEQMSIYDAAMKYVDAGVPLVVIGGKEYGTGSSRDWAAKGTRLLGVRAVITESFERIHRSNLIGMGVLPAQFKDGVTRKTLNIEGTETFSVLGLEKGVTPGMDLTFRITRADGSTEETTLLCRIDTEGEAKYYANGGILHYVLRNMAK